MLPTAIFWSHTFSGAQIAAFAISAFLGTSTREATILNSAAPGRLHSARPVTSDFVGLVTRRCTMVVNPRHYSITTWDLEIPSIPMALTTSSTRLVETPST
jgi:hypothetical protein